MSYPSYDSGATCGVFSPASPPHTPRSKALDAPLHVLTAISNPVRYSSRYRLFADFAKRVQDAGGILHVAEAAFGERPHEIHAPAAHHLQLRTSHELWHKENLLNLLVQRLPSDWKYCAWVDADVAFARPDWVGETVHQLQHYSVVQMFNVAHDLGPDFTPFSTRRSFAASYLEGAKRSRGYGDWHPGYAWGWRRDAIEAVGGFIDWAPLGSADWHMAHALVGNLDQSLQAIFPERYLETLRQWERRAAALRKNIGVVPGALYHYFHGKKKDRQYGSREQIIVHNRFNPDLHLVKDSQGLYQLAPDAPIALRDGIRAYFRSRNEDSNEL